jgi:hypothetical protein
VNIILFFFGSVVCSDALGQRLMRMDFKTPTVCYAGSSDHHFNIPPPAEYVKRKESRVKTATIEINFNPGFTPEAQAAFRTAADIWETLITSSQTITIDAYWTTLGPGVLGGALYTSAFANFDGAQKLNTFYPVALAEKISGKNLNDSEPEIFTQFSNSTDWHYDPLTSPPSGKFDLVTVVLHEIGHGLGISGTFSKTGTQGDFGLNDTTIPIIYDVPVENGVNANLIENFLSPSAALGNELTSQSLFFDSPTSGRPQLYSPSSFSGGSSISHLDETTFNGTLNALMTPFIAPAEKMHDPGLATQMLHDLGWRNVRIVHQALLNTESVVGPFPVTASIQADNGYQASTVTLHYTTNGTSFTSLVMSPTGNVNEFTATIPSTSVPQSYGYYISVFDNDNREFVRPGKIVRPQNSQLQNLIEFETGPDTEPPVITHNPKPFILETDAEWVVDARITDNLGIEKVRVEYLKNNVPIGIAAMTLQTPGEDSVYQAIIDLTSLSLASGDKLQYRIIAVDTAVVGNPTGNVANSPSPSTFHEVNVVGLAPTQDFYTNSFDTPSGDFFGNGFSITQPSGFANPAIHTVHPYPEGTGFPGDQFNYIYQLRIPIRIKEKDATLKFDEIVLVEPGAAGSVFGSENFFDYVVVEGSKDGGVTWTTAADGYDSRDFGPWLTRYNSATSGNNSTAVGDPTLFRSRTIDLQNKFDTGDEVVLRFRLFSDPLAAGWGWAIDNLKIQIDETPPSIFHIHADYLLDDVDVLSLLSAVKDNGGVKEYKLEYGVNNDPFSTFSFTVDPPQSEYLFNLTNLAQLQPGDILRYRFIAVDSSDNEASLPASDYFLVPVVYFPASVTSYTNNFNSATADFAGNFFTVSQPSGFTNGAVHTTHNYPTGFGLDSTSQFIYTLLKPVKISSDNPRIRFDEIAIVEGQASGINFGDPGFNDYVIVEGSKDNGQNWFAFIDGWDARALSAWNSAFATNASGTSAMYKTRTIDMTESGDVEPGDEVLIRFRLFSDKANIGWGWAIDNLYIQDVITSSEQGLSTKISVFPNPVITDQVRVETDALSRVEIQILNIHGQKFHQSVHEPIQGMVKESVSFSGMSPGIYLLHVKSGNQSAFIKLLKSK